MNANTRALFGNKGKKRRTRIMVTIPATGAEDKLFINRLIKLGMNSARINCAHDNPETWGKIIENIREDSSAKYDELGNLVEMAHIFCTLPEVFKDVKPGEPILFDDGEIEGIIAKADGEELLIKIENAKETGSKQRADKGINLPVSDLTITGLTSKDLEDLTFVATHADAVNVSFVNDKEDVQQLLEKLKELGSEIGIILKIETRKGFNNLPQILLTAMQNYPIGVMIARGDLAIETGWKNIATIQEEILRICEAAHVPHFHKKKNKMNGISVVPFSGEITGCSISYKY